MLIPLKVKIEIQKSIINIGYYKNLVLIFK